MHFDGSYIKTIGGILRIVELALLIILLICSASASSGYGYGSSGGGGWGVFVGLIGFFVVLAWLLFYLFHIHDKAPNVPWLLIEMIFYAVWFVFLLITGIVLAVLASETQYIIGYYWSNIHSSAGAGAFFAFLTAVVFAVHLFFIFKNWRNRTTIQNPIGGHP